MFNKQQRTRRNRRVTKNKLRKHEIQTSVFIAKHLSHLAILNVNENWVDVGDNHLFRLRGLIDDLIYYHLNLDVVWTKQKIYREYVDLYALQIVQSTTKKIFIVGEQMWSATESKLRSLEWWKKALSLNDDKQNNKWKTEPIEIKLELPNNSKMSYEIKFGSGNTHRLLTNRVSKGTWYK